MLKIFENTLLKNTGIYTITNILNTAIPFLMLPILTRYLTPENYGTLSMFSLLVAFTSPFVGVNVNGAIARQYYNQEEVDIWEFVGNCVFILIASVCAVSVVFFVSASFIANYFAIPSQMLCIVLIFTMGQFINNILLNLFQVQKMALYYSLFNIFLTLLNMGLSILFVVILKFSWQGRVLGQVSAVILFSLITITFLIRNRWVKFSINKDYLRIALLFGLPLIPHAMSGSIISMTDRLFITNMVGLDSTGVYTVGDQIGSLINILASSFNIAYVPWLYERLKKNEFNTKVKIVQFTYLYFILIMVASVFLGIIAPYILNTYLGKEFNDSSVYVLWIAIGYAFNGMYLMVVNYIFYAEKTKLLAMVTFITALLNIVLNYFFIKIYGAIGAAQATTITFFVKFLIVWILSNRVLKMPWNLIKHKKIKIFWRN